MFAKNPLFLRQSGKTNRQSYKNHFQHQTQQSSVLLQFIRILPSMISSPSLRNKVHWWWSEDMVANTVLRTCILLSEKMRGGSRRYFFKTVTHRHTMCVAKSNLLICRYKNIKSAALGSTLLNLLVNPPLQIGDIVEWRIFLYFIF